MRKSTTMLILIGFALILNFGFQSTAQSIKNWVANLNPFSTTIVEDIAEDLEDRPEDSNSTVQIALLLDTSGSMNGLIEQAKSQLWQIVNELSEAEHDNETPNLEIALYEYGNDRLSSHNGFIRQVTPFTRDMDLVSEQLFSLSTNGGDEFCGRVISTSLQELEWSTRPNDLKMIYIAGNEGFNQGSISYSLACKNAKNKDVIVNTIFCGNLKEGINTFWKDGADLAGGNYMSIDHNQATKYIDSPYDDEIAELNNELNRTYIPYGKDGQRAINNQAIQDNNADKFSKANKADRTLFKCSKNYSNEKWDFVDAYKKDKKVVQQKSKLPEAFRGKSEEEVEVLVQQKLEERKDIQTKIKDLSKVRKNYIAKEKAKSAPNFSNLESNVLATVKEQAQKKGYKFK